MNREAAFADRGARVGEALEGRKSKHGQKPAPIYGFARRPATATRLSLLAFSPLSAPPSSPARQSALPAWSTRADPGRGIRSDPFPVPAAPMEKVKNLLKPRPTPQQQLREWQRRLRNECRVLDRQIRGPTPPASPSFPSIPPTLPSPGAPWGRPIKFGMVRDFPQIRGWVLLGARPRFASEIGSMVTRLSTQFLRSLWLGATPLNPYP